MKMKSYNIFATFSALLIIISLIFFLIIKSNKLKEKESFFLNKVSITNEELNIEQLTPLEKEILDQFEKIPKNKYASKYKEIVENCRVLLNLNSERNTGVYILKKLLASDQLTPSGRLFVLDKLRILDTSSGNVVNTIKSTIEYLNLAEKLNSDHDIVRAKISLSWIFTNLEGYKAAIDLLNSIDRDIKNMNFPEISRIKCSLYFYLAENYYLLKKYDLALNYLNKFPNIEKESVEYQKNILLLKNILATRIYTDLNNQKLAKDSLDKAKFLLKNIQTFYFTDLENFYILSSESYILKYDINNFSPNTLEKFIENLKNYGDILFLKSAFKLLFSYYFEINDFDNYKKLAVNYDKYLDNVNRNNNKVFSLYLIENLENDHYIKENENLYKNMILLFISIFIILGVSYQWIIFLNKKARIDTLTTIRNRLAFKEDINSLKGNNYCMLLFDIDNFKKINDTFGHEFGDEVLSTIGKILKTIENKEISIYRVGGEEFAILFAHFNERFAMDSCEYIRKSIENIHWKYPITVTISGGFSKATKNTYAECDRRLYKAKSSGKNMIIYQHINEGDVK